MSSRAFTFTPERAITRTNAPMGRKVNVRHAGGFTFSGVLQAWGAERLTVWNDGAKETVSVSNVVSVELA